MVADRLKIRQKQLKARQSRQNQVYLAVSCQKQVRCDAGQSQGTWRRDLYLVLECTCFWHKGDQVYLFFGKKQKYNTGYLVSGNLVQAGLLISEHGRVLRKL